MYLPSKVSNTLCKTESSIFYSSFVVEIVVAVVAVWLNLIYLRKVYMRYQFNKIYC